MTVRDRLHRSLSPSLFALIALSFLLPFATVSCDNASTTFTGIQLVTRSVPSGGTVDEGADCSADLSTCVQNRGSAPATVAFAAALTGLLLALLGLTNGKAWCGKLAAERGWCAAVGIGALLWLVEPALEPFGPDVSLHAGYDLALLLFLAAAVVEVRPRWQRRRRRAGKKQRGLLRVHLGALCRYLFVGTVIIVVAAGSDATIQSIGGYSLVWLVFAVGPSWLVLGLSVARWSCQGRPGLSDRVARWEALLWLGPLLALALCSRRARPFLLAPLPSLARAVEAG